MQGLKFLTNYIILFIVGLTAHQVTAGVVTVTSATDSGAGSLRQSVINALPGDTIRFDPALNEIPIMIVSGHILISKNLTIIGNDTTNTVLQGDLLLVHKIFEIAPNKVFQLHELRITKSAGGAIFNRGKSKFFNILFDDNTANHAVILNSGHLVLTNTVLRDNVGLESITILNEDSLLLRGVTLRNNSNLNGYPGIKGEQDSYLSIKNSEIADNKLGNRAAIYLESGSVARIDSTIISGHRIDSTLEFSSGIHAISSDIIISHSQFLGNTGGYGGGAAFIDCTGEVSYCTFDANYSDEGGSIYHTGSLLTKMSFINDTLINGRAYGGGGITSAAGRIEIHGCVISNNSSALGGGLWLSSDSADLTSNHIFLNEALAGGGGIFIDAEFTSGDNHINISQTEIYSNKANHPEKIASGGGILATASNNNCNWVNLDTVLIYDNTADLQGGGICDISKTTGVNRFHISKSKIFGNTAEQSGGGWSSAGKGVGIFDSVKIYGNDAGLIGGGLSFQADYDGTLSRTTISNNTSLYGGGLAVGIDGKSTLAACHIIGNEATTLGGGIYGTGDVSISHSVVAENVAQLGGGLFLQSTNPSDKCIANNILISGNHATGGTSIPSGGGGIYVLDMPTTILHSTIAGNIADGSGGGIWFTELTLINSIVAKNIASTHPDIFSTDSLGQGAANLVGDASGLHEFSETRNLLGTTSEPIDPLFIMDVPQAPSSGGDLHLRIESPAINAGFAYENYAVDLDSLPRISCVIDIGAYEFQLEPPDTSLFSNLVTNASGDVCIQGTLPYAVLHSKPGDTIRFSSELDGIPINLSGSELTITHSLTILGRGVDKTVIDGNDQSRILATGGDIKVNIHHLTMQKGSSGGGSAIHNYLSTIHLSHAKILGNFGSFTAGAIYTTGGSMTISNTIVAGNSCTEQGGGGIVCREGIVNLINSSISGNSGLRAGGIMATHGSGIYMYNSIIVKNINIGNDPSFPATDLFISENSTASGSNNFIGDSTGQHFFLDGVNGNMVGTPAAPLDPMFLEDVPTPAPSLGGNLALMQGSPAIDAGTPDTTGLDIGAFDLAGSARILSGRIDIGPYEYLDLAPCTQDTIYATAGLMMSNLLPENLVAIKMVQSDGVVESGNSYLFQAGEEVLLMPNFEVQAGGLLTISTEECGGASIAAKNPAAVQSSRAAAQVDKGRKRAINRSLKKEVAQRLSAFMTSLLESDKILEPHNQDTPPVHAPILNNK